MRQALSAQLGMVAGFGLPVLRSGRGRRQLPGQLHVADGVDVAETFSGPGKLSKRHADGGGFRGELM